MTTGVKELVAVYRPVKGADGAERIGWTDIPTSPIQPDTAVSIFRNLGIHEEASEVFWLLLLDAKHRPLAVHLVSRGALSSCPVSTQSVFRAALLSNAAALITAHNHPSGDPIPSMEDRLLWARLDEAGKLLDVKVLDNLIVCPSSAWSSTFGESGK